MAAWKLKKDDVEKICELYQTTDMDLTQIGKLYNVDKAAIFYHLRKNNIPFKNKWKIDENYFDKIDSQEKAYFLGLMYSDGYNTDRNTIGIALQERDKDILEVFRKEIKLEKPLALRNRSSERNRKNQYKLVFINRHMSKRLIELGCVHKKSLVLDFPNSSQVPEELLNHFIRGVWDGDGHIGIYTKRRDNYIFYNVALTSTKMFCDKLSEITEEKLGIHSSVSKKNNNGITSVLCISSQHIKFLDWLYKDATIYLQRKYDKYKEIEKHYASK